MGGQDSNSAAPLVEPLTRREHEVLTFLSEGFSAPEIAEQLTLAVSSVKFHIQHLYGKLGVNSKRQALVRARQIGLLEALPSASPSEPTQPSPLGLSGPAAFQAVPARPASGRPGRKDNLPLQVTRFFGRELEIAKLKERLAEYRLVTLTGSGGVGKTRLSLRAASDVLADFRDGVWLVELAPLSDPALVAQQAASSLGLRDDPGRPVIDTLTDYLRERQVLLVLDNCEHLLEACARLADSLLRACPRLRILASSREPLGIAGEAVFSVPSLTFPDPKQLPPIDQLNDYMALNLFIDRARLVLPDYQAAAHNIAALARICQRLDGIPLAIEMAAARLSILTAEQLADRLDDTFRLLTGGSRAALPRQQTLRATIDWSYKLLTEPERVLIQRLSVFAGGCTLEAAEAVCADSPGEALEARQAILPDDIVDVLASLAAKSMVIADRRPGEEPRYRLLEFVRQYAREKLQDAGDSARLHRRHRDYFLTFTETDFPKHDSEDWASWERKLRDESDNLRLALEWSFSGDPTDLEAGPRLLMASWNAFPTHAEQADWFQRAIAWCQSHVEISAKLYAHLLRIGSALVSLDDPQTALALTQQAIEISRGLGLEGREILLANLFWLASQFAEAPGDLERASAPLAEAEAILMEIGPDGFPPGGYLGYKAAIASAKAHFRNHQGNYQEAKGLALESLRITEEVSSPSSGQWPLTALGTACLGLGEYEAARDHFLQLLSIAEAGWYEADALRYLGLVDLQEGNLVRATEYCRNGLRKAAALPDNNVVASCLGLAAGIAAKQGQPSRAARLSGASAALWKKQGRRPWEDSSLDTLLPGWREGPDQAAIFSSFEAGQAMNAEQATAFALGDTSD
jgi:predicted ATPase/DNA-binding CsgD family transcriptional regulator